jgi:flagellar motor switch protein FliG
MKVIMGAKKITAKDFGTQAVAELLHHVDEATRDRLLESLAKEDPEAWARIQDRMFSFEDLANLDDATFRAFLEKAPRAKLPLALRKASDELKAAFFRNLPQAAAATLAEDIASLGPQRLSLVEAAQRELIEIAKTLRKKT